MEIAALLQPTTETLRQKRSLVACGRCRALKLKCASCGPNTFCMTCNETGARCVHGYSAKIPQTPVTRGGRSVSACSSRQDSHGLPLLTMDVWEELYKIWEERFASCLFFLHKPSFFMSVQQLSFLVPHNITADLHSSALSIYPHQLLLAFLALTSRFHQLVSSLHGDQSETAVHFAKISETYMDVSEVSLENIQTYIMLGYHAWLMGDRPKGWVTIRLATSYAQTLGYFFEDDKKDRTSRKGERELSEAIPFIYEEIKRRTAWNCFVLDAMFSLEFGRPHVRYEDLPSIQLPCSDARFHSGSKIRTRMLAEDDQEYSKRRERVSEDGVGWEVAPQENALVGFVQSLHRTVHIRDSSCIWNRQWVTWETVTIFRADKAQTRV